MPPKSDILHSNVGLIYHIMGKYGISKKDQLGDMGQFIWEKLCKYIDNFDPKKGTLGTWAGWQIWAARKYYLEKLIEHRDRFTSCEDMWGAQADETMEERRDYLAHDKIKAVMDRVLVSNNGGASHREVIRLCWEEEMSYRSASKILKVSKARIGSIVEASKARLQYELQGMSE
jgi:RNA polymerase sigma factor (sigma-70 family)